jgi:hypothetical protein
VPIQTPFRCCHARIHTTDPGDRQQHLVVGNIVKQYIGGSDPDRAVGFRGPFLGESAESAESDDGGDRLARPIAPQ